MKWPFSVAIFTMTTLLIPCAVQAAPRLTSPPKAPEVTQAIRASIAKNEIAGAVTFIGTSNQVVDFQANGFANIQSGAPMRMDSIFWIASMTKPVTATAILMLQDEGKLSIDDPVAKYIPELANLKTAKGVPGNITLRQLLTHTSGMGEATPEEIEKAKTLADLVPIHASKTLKFVPGTKWEYCQSGMNTLGRVIEVVSGKSYPQFLQKRIFNPLGMKDTTFYPSKRQLRRLATTYRLEKGTLQETNLSLLTKKPLISRERIPAANGGLFSTAPDYARFAQMLLNGGVVGKKQFLKPETVQLMTSLQSGDLQTGFTGGMCWGLGCGIVRKPQGVTATLSPGTYGHGGVYGTQGWIDPVKKTVYLLMVQRSNFPNADDTEVRKAFYKAAATALEGGAQ